MIHGKAPCHFCGSAAEFSFLLAVGGGLIGRVAVCRPCALARGGRARLEVVSEVCQSCLEPGVMWVARRGRPAGSYCAAHAPADWRPPAV